MSAAPRRPAGVLLVRGRLDAALRWGSAGLTGVGIAPVEHGWLAVAPVSATSGVAEPYDDAMTLLLNRPLPRRLRPAIGFAVVREQAIVVVTPSRWRSRRRWLAWQPGTGLARPGRLPVARLSDLVRVAGVDHRSGVRHVADVVHDPRGDALTLLGDLLTALGLPGRDVLAGTVRVADLRGGRRVEPSGSQAPRFERMVREDASWRDEMEGRR